MDIHASEPNRPRWLVAGQKSAVIGIRIKNVDKWDNVRIKAVKINNILLQISSTLGSTATPQP